MNGVNVRIEFDKQKLADLVETLCRFPQALPGVISRALNRTAQSMRSHVSADAAHALGTTERLIKSRIHVSWASESKLRATVYIDEKGFSLYLFKPVQNRMGVVTTRGFEGTFTHAFIATPWFRDIWRNQKTGERIASASYPGPPSDMEKFERAWKKRTGTSDTPSLPWQIEKAGQRYPGVYVRTGKSRFPLAMQRSPGAVETIEKLGGWEQRYSEALAYLEKRLQAETERVLAGGKWSGVASGLNETWAEWQMRLGGEYQIEMWIQPVPPQYQPRMSA